METEERGALLANASSRVGSINGEDDGCHLQPSESQPQKQEHSSAATSRHHRSCRRQSVLGQELELLTRAEGEGGREEEEEERGGSAAVGRKALVVDAAVPSQASQKLAESNKLEDQINLQHLVELMRIFHEADENGSDGLDIDEFRAAFGQILGKGKNDQQMAIMFMKIDTNCDGTVDWDEFCTYMLLEYQEKDVMAGEKLPPFPYPLRVLHSSHRETISRITFLPNLNRRSHDCSGKSHEAGGQDWRDVDGRILSVCKDGTLCFWKSNLTLQKVVTLECSRPKLAWVTDMVVLTNINRVLLSFTENCLSLYDLSSATFERQIIVVGFPHCIVSMDYWFDPKDFNRAVLVLGDTGGGVCVMEFHSATTSLFGVQTCSKQVSNLRVPFAQLLHLKPERMRVAYMPRVHRDWVCAVQYWPCMEYLVSCSSDSACSLHLVDLHRRKQGSSFRVRKGVAAFDYSREWNIIATGGLDRAVRLWNPYVTGKPIAVLKGHSTAILHVAINSCDGHVLSFSKDLELRVWDIADQVCLQSCHRFQQQHPQPPSAFFLHPHTGTLLIGTNQLGVLEPYRDDDQHSSHGEVVSHESPLCAALYNENFHQVVSGCHGGVVSVWDVDTGEKTIQFSRCHGDAEITAMAFDSTGRRLLTGGRDGSLRMWNFNNGACLSVLKSHYSTEVTSICFLKQKVVVGGWSRQLAVYRDTRESDDGLPKYWEAGLHREDILCMAEGEPGLLASGSYDGDIVVWNADLERATCKLNASCRGSREGQQGSAALHTPRLSTLPGSYRGRQKVAWDSSGHQMEQGSSATCSSAEGRAEQRESNERAVEKLAFLKTRPQDESAATLVACGSCGWVQLWNIQGAGLVGEFNIWSTSRHQLQGAGHCLQAVTALRVDSNDHFLFSGNSLGYIQVWDISDYCLSVPVERRPVLTPPPLLGTWRGHLSSVVSLDLAEGRGLLLSASTDRCVRLWTTHGRFIGTFGEKAPWKLSYPLRPLELPRKTPPDLSRTASFRTIQTVSGPFASKWKLAKNLFRVLRQSTKLVSAFTPSGHTHQPEAEHLANKSILGRCYQRRTRFRQPILPARLRQSDGRLLGVYSILKCSDLREPEGWRLPPLTAAPRQLTVGAASIAEGEDGSAPAAGPMAPRVVHTEASLLPALYPARKVTIHGHVRPKRNSF